MFIALALVALGFGYKVFLEASDVKNDNRRTFGRIVGIYIMGVSFAMSVGSLAKMAHCDSLIGKCPMFAKICAVKK